METFYKIKHRASGLYFEPCGSNGRHKTTQLSKEGKVYQRKPSTKQCRWWLQNVKIGIHSDGSQIMSGYFHPKDWIIVKFEAEPEEIDWA